MEKIDIDYTPEDLADIEEMAKETVEALKKSSIESGARSERWEKIFSVEKNKWPHDMGNKQQSEIPENLQPLLNECITKSQKIAREACQTEELTQEYLKNNT